MISVLSSPSASSHTGKAAIEAAIADFHSKTCLRFVKKTSGDGFKYWIKFGTGGG